MSLRYEDKKDYNKGTHYCVCGTKLEDDTIEKSLYCPNPKCIYVYVPTPENK